MKHNMEKLNNLLCFLNKKSINKLMSVKKPCIVHYEQKKGKSQFADLFYLAPESWTVCKLVSEVKSGLKFCDFGIDISITYVWILMKELFWILNNLSLTLRDTLEGTPKVISNQNLFSRFQLILEIRLTHYLIPPCHMTCSTNFHTT